MSAELLGWASGMAAELRMTGGGAGRVVFARELKNAERPAELARKDALSA